MKREATLTVIICLIVSLSAINAVGKNDIEPFFNLVLWPYGGGMRPDHGLFIAQYLRDINIEVDVYVDTHWPLFSSPYTNDNWDMTFADFYSVKTQDMREFYTEGALNLFRLDKSIPYQNKSEQLQNEVVTTTDLESRNLLNYNWQILVMDDLLPLLPLYSTRTYEAVWSNTLGYDVRWGLVNSLPYMEYDGLHEGQESVNEFRTADANWRDLNPLRADDTSSSFISSFISDHIITFSPDYTSLKTSLVNNWEQIDDFHYKFTLRSNVYWNPSFNVTGRYSNSNPLDISTTPLMLGLKNNEDSNGTSRQVTAKDAVFTYLAYANPIVSDNPSYFDWISDCYVDPVDPLSFHIEVDGNPDTIEIEPYVDSWQKLDIGILPEFFLNSTDSTISQTSGGVNCTGLYEDILDTNQWLSFSTSAFGCGQYMLDYFVKNSVTVLQASQYWMSIGAIDGTSQDLDIETVKVRVIPDISAELAEFLGGKLDIANMLYAFPAERKQMQADARFEVQSKLNFGFSFLAFNMQRDFIGGPDNNEWINGTDMGNYTKACAVRKAMCYAIDRDEINQVLHDGEYLVNHQPMPSSATTYGVFPIQYGNDLDLAWEWMVAAGYERPKGSNLLFIPLCISLILLVIYRRRK